MCTGKVIICCEASHPEKMATDKRTGILQQFVRSTPDCAAIFAGRNGYTTTIYVLDIAPRDNPSLEQAVEQLSGEVRQVRPDMTAMVMPIRVETAPSYPCLQKCVYRRTIPASEPGPH